MRTHSYEPSRPELYRMILRAVERGDLSIAWMQVRVLRRRMPKRDKKARAA